MPSTAADLRRANLSRALRAVHVGAGTLTRADLGRQLGCVRATVGALVSDLDDLGLVTEDVAPATGRRGRPSAHLVPAPGGPVVVALEIASDCIRIATVALGGQLQQIEDVPLPDQEVDKVVTVSRSVLQRRLRGLGRRCAGVGIAMHGLVDRTTTIVSAAPGLGWEAVHLDVIGLLGLPPGRRTHIDNIAQCSALAEITRGRGRGLGTVLYLHAAVGLGGALIVNDRPLAGRRGFAGEYGHLPFGTANLRCRCGGRGCWETEVDQLALARAAGRAVTPRTAAGVAADVFADASRGNADARRAVHQAGAALGRGIGALVNAHDPDLVVLAAHAADLHAGAADVVRQAQLQTCMPVHRPDPPPVEASVLAANGGLIGAAESVFNHLIDDPTTFTTAWTATARPAGHP
jgi:predicted NBD/HSP70 family sugar kinase